MRRGRLALADIVRRPHRGPSLGPWEEFADAVNPAGDLAWLSSWLDECLPAPDAPA